MARFVDLDKVTVWHCPHNIPQMREWAFGLPMEDVAPVVHAHWILYDANKDIWDCSNCKTHVFVNVLFCNGNYCPHCGAKMDEELNDET